MSKTILIVHAIPNPNETEALEYYTKHAGAILKVHKGKIMNRYQTTHNLTEDKFHPNIMMMEFEDNSIIATLSTSTEYLALIPYRDKAFTSISIAFIETV